MNPIEKVFRRIDAFQQRHLVPGFIIALTKKYGDDNGGALAVQLTYSMFTTVFPLLLLLVTILAIVLANNPGFRHAVLHSTFNQFPLVGNQLESNIHALKNNSTFGLALGVAGMVYGSTSLAGAGLYAMEQIWNIPGAVRPNYLTRMTRSLAFLLILGVGLIVTTFLSSFGTFGQHNFWLGAGSESLAAVVNIWLYLAAFRVLTPKQIATRLLVPGVVLGGIIWTVLQALGGYVVGHYLKDDNAVYGTFGTVLGLIAWIYIGSQVTVYAAELNTVLYHHLWPRGMVQPPLTKADQVSIALQAIENQRRPEQVVSTYVRGAPMTQDEFRAADFKVDTSKIGTFHLVPNDCNVEEHDQHEKPDQNKSDRDRPGVNRDS